MSGIRSQARLTALLTRHLLHVMRHQRARVAILWAALALALGIGIGLLAFTTSIEDSFGERGRAVGGVSDVQVQAVGASSLPADLVERLQGLGGTRYAIPLTQQRIALQARGERTVATAIGVDRSARRLRGAVQRDLGVRGNRPQRAGLALTTVLAGELGVERGERVRLFAFETAVRLRVTRLVDVDSAIEDVVTLPRRDLEALRGAPGRPTVIYVKLARGASVEDWERRAEPLLPSGATLTTLARNQAELSHVLDFTVRAPTLVFGMVVLAIAALLIYVLQLMRMLERQEDLGLLRALGSRRLPLMLAECAILAALLVAAIPAGIAIGAPIAHYLAAQVPTYLTDVFGFNMEVAVRPHVVVIAAAIALAVGVTATVGALIAARGSISEQLGRSPQAGATVVSTISTRYALVLLGSGIGFLALSLFLSEGGLFPVAVVMVLIGLAMATPGVVGLVAIWLGRRGDDNSKAVLVARGAIEANPRRAALAAAIMALGIAAVIPPQLGESALVERIALLTDAVRPGAQELLASDDAFSSVPVSSRFARGAVREGAQSQPTVFAFIPYRGRKIELRGIVPRSRESLFRADGIGLPSRLSILRAHPKDVLVSRVMSAGLGIEVGDAIELNTPAGAQKFRVRGKVEDFAWPSGTIYMDIDRYRALYRTGAISVLVTGRRANVDDDALKRLAPLHTVSGAEFSERIADQMDQSTRGLVAMRVLTLLAALVAVGGIITTSVFARRREWAVLRAMGMRESGLFAALALETLLVMAIGGVCGAIGGVVSFVGPGLGFLESQGYVVDGSIPIATVAGITIAAVAIGALAAALPAWLTARAPLSRALSYE